MPPRICATSAAAIEREEKDMTYAILSRRRRSKEASALVAALSTIIILSLVGAGVLMNCSTRYNASATQVKGWKEALVAAEAGGDMGFQILRKNVMDPPAAFGTASGWTAPAPSPIPIANSWGLGFNSASPMTFGPDARLRARVTVDRFQLLPGSTSVGYYRIRSWGTAQITGLKRVSMDNRADPHSQRGQPSAQNRLQLSTLHIHLRKR